MTSSEMRMPHSCGDAEGGTCQGPTPAAITHIAGIDRFDIELESWLNARQWSIRTNLLSHRNELHRPSGVVPLTDERLSEIQFSFIYAKNGREPARDKLANALDLIGERRAYHPVRDYLGSLQWDGEQRLDGWLIRYAGAPDTALNRAFGRKILCAAVRRAKTPGCKFDHILVLQGVQDLGKSSLIRALCPDPSWFTDQAKIGADAKETIERTAGAWLVELAELDGLGRREANAVKSFVTTVSDKARLAYGRYAVERARQFILFGTTNEASFLTDLTGNRRWWIVRVGECDVLQLQAVRDQLWAEAVRTEPQEALWLDTDQLKSEAVAVADGAADFGPWYEVLANKIPSGPIKVAVADAWQLVGIRPAEVNKISVQSRISMRKAMAGLGFQPESKNVRCGGKQVRAFVRGPASTARWWAPNGAEDWDRNETSW